MFRIIRKNDTGGMHIKVIRREEISEKPKVEETNENIRAFGIGRVKGDVLEEKEIVRDKSLKHVCEICNKTFDKEWGLKIHKLKMHK